MKNELLYFNGLYGDLNANYGVDYIFSELIKTRSQTFGWVVRPHIHNRLFQIFCVEFGEVTFQGNNYEKKLKGPFLIIVPPMAIHGLIYSPDVKGRILTISDSYVETVLPSNTPTFATLNKPEFIYEFEEIYSFEKIMELLIQIDLEIFSDGIEQHTMVQALICQLFIMLLRMVKAEGIIDKQDSSYLRHFNQFQKIIKSSGKMKSIADIAGKLQISSIHLNRICKTITKKSALQIVHEHAIGEAEKYLKHTSLTIAEIAYLLNFEYPNYFSKLFKKYHQITPLQYRNGIKSLKENSN